MDCDPYQYKFPFTHWIGKAACRAFISDTNPHQSLCEKVREDHKIKVALFWAACDIYTKIIQKTVSTDELKYTVSQFDISQMLIF